MSGNGHMRNFTEAEFLLRNFNSRVDVSGAGEPRLDSSKSGGLPRFGDGQPLSSRPFEGVNDRDVERFEVLSIAGSDGEAMDPGGGGDYRVLI